MPELRNALHVVRSFVLLALIGCTVKAYDGVTLPPSEVSEIKIRSSGDSVIEGVTIDGTQFSSWGDNYQLLPGEHTISVRYRYEGPPSNCFGGYCEASIQYGSCAGSLSTLAGRPYLITVRDQNGYVTATALAKSYFDLTVRADEPSVGYVSCAVDDTLDRIIPDPS